MAASPGTTVIELVGRAFPECLTAYRDLQRLDGDYENLMYDFSAQILMPMVFIPLMEAPESDVATMRRLFGVVEELARQDDEDILTFVKIEFCESLLVHDEWYQKSWPFMGEATKTAYGVTQERWQELGWLS